MSYSITYKYKYTPLEAVPHSTGGPFGLCFSNGNCQFYSYGTNLSSTTPFYSNIYFSYSSYSVEEGIFKIDCSSSAGSSVIQGSNCKINYIPGVQSSQVQNVGTALIQGGGSVLHIGLQLLPYLIFITIIFIIFLIIKRFSGLNPKY